MKHAYVNPKDARTAFDLESGACESVEALRGRGAAIHANEMDARTAAYEEREAARAPAREKAKAAPPAPVVAASDPFAAVRARTEFAAALRASEEARERPTATERLLEITATGSKLSIADARTALRGLPVETASEAPPVKPQVIDAHRDRKAEIARGAAEFRAKRGDAGASALARSWANATARAASTGAALADAAQELRLNF